MKIPLWLSLLPLALVACSPSRSPEVAAADASVGSSTSVRAVAHVAATTSTLASYRWQLHDAVDANNQRLDALFDNSGKPLQLDFTDRRVSVSNACNGISGDYRIVDGHLVPGPLVQTMMACADPTLMQRETTIKHMLKAKPTLITSGSDGKILLTLSADDGQTLTFAGQPTTETR
jgi:heat shock protein HslJ